MPNGRGDACLDSGRRCKDIKLKLDMTKERKDGQNQIFHSLFGKKCIFRQHGMHYLISFLYFCIEEIIISSHE